MPSPTRYERTYSFTDFQGSNPSSPLPGTQVDNELENVEQSLNGAIDAINDVRRSDGKLKNGIVTVDSLSPQVAAGVGSGALASAEAAAASADAAGDSAVAAAASASAAATSAEQANDALEDAQIAQEQADTARTGAQTARDYANQWATAAEGVDVDDGVNPVGKSSYHWAQVALGAAEGNLPDGAVTTPKLADEAVTTEKIDDGAVTPEKVKSDEDFGSAIGAAVWSDGAYRTMRDRARDTYCILDAPGQPDPTGANDSTAALKAMLSAGIRCELTRGDFVTLDSLLVTTPGQVIFGHGMGIGYGNHPSPLRDFVPMTRIIAAGDAARKRVMTRRLMRTSASDPNDPAMNACLDIEADGVQLRDFTVWLDVDYTDASPSNLGANWDNGIFVGTRPLFQAWNVGVMGYFRRAGFYFDVSAVHGWPELLDYDGNALEDRNPSEFSGGDGTQLWNPIVYGPRIGMAILGGINDADATNYYDERTGAARIDNRGASGFSDFNVFGGRLYGPSHHSGRRMADPPSTPLTSTNLQIEPDNSPAALYIDGRCNNASSTTHGKGALRGMNFFNTRIARNELLQHAHLFV